MTPAPQDPPHPEDVTAYLRPDAAIAAGDEPSVWLDLGAHWGMSGPLTPLGQDALRLLLSGGVRASRRRIDWRANRFVQPAGERLWLRVDGLLRLRPTRAWTLEYLALTDPESAAALASVADEVTSTATRRLPPLGVAAGLASALPRTFTRARAASARPDAARRHLNHTSDQLVAHVTRLVAKAAQKRTPHERLTARTEVLELLAHRALPSLSSALAPVVVATLLELRTLRGLAVRTSLPDADALALDVLRGLPGRVAKETELDLADVATQVRADATAWGWVAETPASDLVRQYLTGRLPRVAQAAFRGFLDAHGLEGARALDLGAAGWRDDPTPVVEEVKTLLAGAGGAAARDAYTAEQHEAGRSIRALMDASAPGHAQRIKHAARVIRALSGGVDTPAHTIARCFGPLREGLAASASELVEAGRIDAAPDLAFLGLDELREAFQVDRQGLVAARREAWAAESARLHVPRVLVGDGREL